MNQSKYSGASDREEAISGSTAMDEAEFRKLLELFPRVRSRDYVVILSLCLCLFRVQKNWGVRITIYRLTI